MSVTINQVGGFDQDAVLYRKGRANHTLAAWLEPVGPCSPAASWLQPLLLMRLREAGAHGLQPPTQVALTHVQTALTHLGLSLVPAPALTPQPLLWQAEDGDLGLGIVGQVLQKKQHHTTAATQAQHNATVFIIEQAAVPKTGLQTR